MEIDVTKCDYYFRGRCSVSSNINYSLGCYDNDCYYKQLQQLKAENEGLQSLNDFNVQKIETLEAENEELRKEKDKYYQMTLDDEIQLNNLYQELQKESDLGHKAVCEEMDSFFKVMKLQKCLDEIEEIARTLGNQNDVKHRLDDSGIQDLFKIDDDLLTSEEIMRKHILHIIKQAKEVEE